MSNSKRNISSKDYPIGDLVKELQQDKFLVPTFQREFEWQPSNILKLWDSIYKFYPIGSILVWETDVFLHTHRKLGGFVFPHNQDEVRRFKEWQYLLDGQQRATSLLVSMLGGIGRVEDNEAFDYTLYFDTVRAEFFFSNEMEKRRKNVADPRFLVRVQDVPKWNLAFYREIAGAQGMTPEIEERLNQLHSIFTEYKIPVVKVQGVGVDEVCDIFERINQEGKRLDPVDIVVARTYRNEDRALGRSGFYLRDNLRGLQQILIEDNNRFQDLDELTIIQMVALCLRKVFSGKRNPYGITPNALDNLTTDDLEVNWEECQRTILDTIKFLSDQKVHGPGMLPFAYLALPICYYLYRNPRPNRDIASQWFWRNAFGLDEYRASTDVYRDCEEFFGKLQRGERVTIPPLTLSLGKLVRSSYNYRNASSRAVLAFLARQRPVDFSDHNAEVLDNVYLLLSQAPNLHHIYPQNFLGQANNLPPGTSIDSLMNICYLRAKTNIAIRDRNPLSYFRDYENVRSFNNILHSHLIPREFIDRTEYRPDDYREFLEVRARVLAQKIASELPDVEVKITD